MGDASFDNEPTAIDHNRQAWYKNYYGEPDSKEESSKKPIRFSNVADYFKDDNQSTGGKNSFNIAERKYLKVPN